MSTEEKKAPSRKEALEAIMSRWAPAPGTETVPVPEALNRVAAQDMFAEYTLPVVRASAMDGIGVAAAAFQKGIPDTSHWRPGREYARADTGDDFEDRFDAVIPVESVTFLPDGGVTIAPDTAVTAGLNVRPAGSSVKKGEQILPAGRRLRPFDLAALTLGGKVDVAVVKKPVVAFIPTGSELVAPGTPPERGQNIDSNSVMVRAMLEEMGAEPRLFPIVPDDPAALRAALERAVPVSDIVLICGGSSKGGEDFNADIVSSMGEYILHGVASAPGRPMCAAMLAGKPLINVPGPPFAAYFVLDWCVSALVARFLGAEPPARKTVRARLTKDVGPTPGMEILRRLEVRRSADGFEATPVGGRGGCTFRTLTASGQTVTDGGGTGHAAGDVIEVEYLR